MNDTISRQAAIDELQKMYCAAEKWGRTADNHEVGIRAESCMAGIVEMKLRIEKMPSAQLERKKGRWIKQHPMVDTEECSGCGYNILGEEFETPFCPWCGARMRGEEE